MMMKERLSSVLTLLVALAFSPYSMARDAYSYTFKGFTASISAYWSSPGCPFESAINIYGTEDTYIFHGEPKTEPTEYASIFLYSYSNCTKDHYIATSVFDYYGCLDNSTTTDDYSLNDDNGVNDDFSYPACEDLPMLASKTTVNIDEALTKGSVNWVGKKTLLVEECNRVTDLEYGTYWQCNALSQELKRVFVNTTFTGLPGRPSRSNSRYSFSDKYSRSRYSSSGLNRDASATVKVKIDGKSFQIPAVTSSTYATIGKSREGSVDIYY